MRKPGSAGSAGTKRAGRHPVKEPASMMAINVGQIAETVLAGTLRRYLEGVC